MEDIVPAFGALKSQADALYVVQDALIDANNALIITLALSAKLPTISTTSDFAKAGALMSYGPNMPTLFRRAAEIVDKILRGTKPGNIPVEQPTEFDLVINLKTAKALDLTIPDNMLAIANEANDRFWPITTCCAAVADGRFRGKAGSSKSSALAHL